MANVIQEALIISTILRNVPLSNRIIRPNGPFLCYTATDITYTLPFSHLRLVCDRNSQMTRTLTAHVPGNTACDPQSACQQDKAITTR